MTDTEMLEIYVEKLGGTMRLHHWRSWISGWPGSKNEPVPEACGGCGKERDRHPMMRVQGFLVEQWGAR